MSDPLTTLPDRALLNVLKNVPLYELIYSVGQTNVRLRAVVPLELARRHSVVLTHDDDQDKSLNSLREDSPHCGQLLQRALQADGLPLVRLLTLEQYKFKFVPLAIAVQGPALINSLPAITNLTVSYNNISPVFLNGIIRMLNHWSNSLVSLTLYLKEISQFGSMNDLRVIETINGLNSLRHLKICLTKLERVLDFNPRPNLEFMSRLETLCIFGLMDFRPDWLFGSLVQYGSDNLREVCYHSNADYGGHYQRMLAFGRNHRRLASCFNTMSVGIFHQMRWSDRSDRIMRRLCDRFSALTTLQLAIEPFALAGMAPHLDRLQHLITLKLYISRYEDDYDDDAEYDGWPISEANLAPLNGAHLVGNVRLLQLSMDTVSHENIAALRIANFFPNIQVLHVKQYSDKCYICAALDDGQPNVFTIARCRLQALQPFQECAHLNTIEYNPGNGVEMVRITPQELQII